MSHWYRISLTLLTLVATTSALHFYLDANERRCFIEELPTDTIVEGTQKFSDPRDSLLNFHAGHYRALEWDDKTQAYAPHGELGIQVDVEVCALALSSHCF
jgi:hypothetical protein